jgi:hypothetical protein
MFIIYITKEPVTSVSCDEQSLKALRYYKMPKCWTRQGQEYKLQKCQAVWKNTKDNTRKYHIREAKKFVYKVSTIPAHVHGAETIGRNCSGERYNLLQITNSEERLNGIEDYIE